MYQLSLSQQCHLNEQSVNATTEKTVVSCRALHSGCSLKILEEQQYACGGSEPQMFMKTKRTEAYLRNLAKHNSKKIAPSHRTEMLILSK